MAEIETVLITGASRGIGLEFVKQLLTNPMVKVGRVIATCRSPEAATALQELKKNHENLSIVKLNVTDFASLSSLESEVREIVGDKGLTLLINNAGVLPFITKLEDVVAEQFISTLTTNAVAPVMLMKALLPLLKIAANRNADKHNNGLSFTRAGVFNIGALLGSIQKNPECGITTHGYSESKAALNMSTQTLSVELAKDGILVESIHPGVVETDMSAMAPPEIKVTPTVSVTSMLKVLLSLKEKNKNGFYSFTGEVLPF